MINRENADTLQTIAIIIAVTVAIVAGAISIGGYNLIIDAKAIDAGLVQDVVQDRTIWVQKKEVNNGPSGVAR